MAALFAGLPIAYSASEEAAKGPGEEERAGACADAISPEERRLREHLTQLKAALRDLRRKYTEEHPRIRVVEVRIEEIAEILRRWECPRIRPIPKPPLIQPPDLEA